MMDREYITVALAGNPNSGKTTMFNSIVGSRHKTGNYAGVTVDKREGDIVWKGTRIRFIDLPGTYSLTAYSLDEMVARDTLLNERPDVIVDVLDSTNIDRNLFLCLQFQELGIPVIGALNMSDEAEKNGISIDEKQLSSVLHMPFVKTIGSSGFGMEKLLDRVIELSSDSAHETCPVAYGYEIEREVEKLMPILGSDSLLAEKYPIHWLAVKLLEKDGEARRIVGESTCRDEALQQADRGIAWIEEHFGLDSEVCISEQRYGYIRGAVRESVTVTVRKQTSITERLDRVFLNRFAGMPIFLFIFWSIFQLTFILGEYPTAWLETGFSFLASLAEQIIPPGFFRSLIVDGIIGGVGGVFSFVPLIVLLFLFLSILEDTGYMSRAAFVMDKFLHVFGLHGQSFMPLSLGFGCSVPAIMAARTLKNPKDRIITILVIPFMSCGAKLPVYVLFAGVFFGSQAGNVVLSIYLVGIALALFFSTVLRRTVLKGSDTPFVMELPPYRKPTIRGIFFHIWDKTWSYVKRAGTTILFASLFIWIITTFPTVSFTDAETDRIRAEYLASPEYALVRDSQALETPENLAEGEVPQEYIDNARTRIALEQSIAGRIGQIIEPVFRPIGFDWKVAVASITGFAAKELLVSTLGILYSSGGDADEGTESLRKSLRADPRMNSLTAYVIMLFTLIVAPCFAALATIRAELGFRWLVFAALYSSFTAWFVGFLTWQLGSLAGLGL